MKELITTFSVPSLSSTKAGVVLERESTSESLNLSLSVGLDSNTLNFLFPPEISCLLEEQSSRYKVNKSYSDLVWVSFELHEHEVMDAIFS